jgi:hypothetical protein
VNQRKTNELSKEIEKLEVRLKDYLSENREFIKELKECINELNKFNNYLQESEIKNERIKETKLEITDAFNEVFQKKSKSEHEKSHLLESFGSIILLLERIYQRYMYE